MEFKRGTRLFIFWIVGTVLYRVAVQNTFEQSGRYPVAPGVGEDYRGAGGGKASALMVTLAMSSLRSNCQSIPFAL